MTKLRKYSLDKKKKKAFHPVNSDLGLWFLWLQQYYDLFSLEHSTISENDTVIFKEGALLFTSLKLQSREERGLYIPSIYKLGGKLVCECACVTIGFPKKFQNCG